MEGNDVAQLLEALGQLKSIVEEQLAEIHDRLEHVTEVVREAVEQLGVLSDIEEEKREEIQWAVRNGQPIFHLTSMSSDPADLDWEDHFNKLTPEDLPQQPDRPTQARYQGTLWRDDEHIPAPNVPG